MSWRACVLLTLLAGVRGDYPSSTPAPGYTTPTDTSPASLHDPPATYSAPTHVPYTTVVVHAQSSTPSPSAPSGTAVSTPPGTTLYSSDGPNDFHGYSYPRPFYPNRDPYSPLHQQLSLDYISQFYKRPPYVFPHFQQPPTPSPSLHPPAFRPHSCPTSNYPPFHPQQPYIQSTFFHVPNPLSLLNGFVPPNSFHPSVPRGPLPSPGYYSPTPSQPPSQPLFSVAYSSPINRPSPYNVH